MFECPICLAPITDEGPTPEVVLNDEPQRGRGRKRARENGIFANGTTGQCTTPCGHIFHIECLRQCLQAQGGPYYQCPTCKKRVSPKNVVRVYMTCDSEISTQLTASPEPKRLAKASRKSKTNSEEPAPAPSGENVAEMIRSLHAEIALLKDFLLLEGSENPEVPAEKRQKCTKAPAAVVHNVETPVASTRASPMVAPRSGGSQSHRRQRHRTERTANSSSSRVSSALRIDKIPRESPCATKLMHGIRFAQPAGKPNLTFSSCSVL